MALSSRAHAFSVEALVGRPSKRKLQDPSEEAQPELLEKEDGEEEEEEEERNCCSAAAGKKIKQLGKYRCRGPQIPEPANLACWIRKSQTGLATLLEGGRAAGLVQPSGCRGSFRASKFSL